MSLPSSPVPARWVGEQGTAPPNGCQGRRAAGSCKIDLGKNMVQHAEPGSGAATLATCPRPLCPRSRGRGNSSLGLPNPSSHGSDYRLSHPRREKAPPGVGRTPSHPADRRVTACPRRKGVSGGKWAQSHPCSGSSLGQAGGRRGLPAVSGVPQLGCCAEPEVSAAHWARGWRRSTVSPRPSVAENTRAVRCMQPLSPEGIAILQTTSRGAGKAGLLSRWQGGEMLGGGSGKEAAMSRALAPARRAVSDPQDSSTPHAGPRSLIQRGPPS